MLGWESHMDTGVPVDIKLQTIHIDIATFLGRVKAGNATNMAVSPRFHVWFATRDFPVQKAQFRGFPHRQYLGF